MYVCNLLLTPFLFLFHPSIAVASYAIAEELAMGLRSGKEWDLCEK